MPRSILAVVGALSSLLLVCVPLTPAAAQADSEPVAALGDAQPDARALILELDRLHSHERHDEADSVYELLLKSRVNAVVAGLEVLSQEGTSSEITVRLVCELASDDVSTEMSDSVLEYVLSSPSLTDGTKSNCIHRLRHRIGSSFRDRLLQFAMDPDRDPNLRISALKVAKSNWPLDSKPTLVLLLQSAQDGVIHHKVLQYLAASGDPDALPLIEQFVLNRDPATAGKSLAKEYGLLILRRHLGDGVVPLLASILRDESWPEEVQERTVDLLAHTDLSGGLAILERAREQAGSRLQSRIDAAIREGEE